jgi:ATP-dependent Clp protease ATP-binding subunit ClpC
MQLISEQIERQSGRGERGDIPPQGLPPRAKRVIEIAAAESTQMGHNYIGSEHLLMGLVREYNCAAAEILRLTGADLNKIYTDIINIFKSEDHKQRKAATMGKSGKKNET